MKKLFLLIFFLLNLTIPVLICMQDEAIKKIDLPNACLFLKENNLWLIKERLILDDVIEIIESPTKKFLVAIVEKKSEQNKQTIIFIINIEKYTKSTSIGLQTIEPLSLNKLDSFYGEDKLGDSKVSDDGKKITIKIGGAINCYINN